MAGEELAIGFAPRGDGAAAAASWNHAGPPGLGGGGPKRLKVRGGP